MPHRSPSELSQAAVRPVKPPPLHIYRLIETLMGNPDARTRFASDPDSLFDEFAVAAGEREALLAGDVEAMARLGVHPSMQFKLLVATDRAPVKMVSVRYYLERK